MLAQLTSIKTYLNRIVTVWQEAWLEQYDKWLASRALDYLTKHIKIESNPFEIKASRSLQHPFHTLFEVESTYFYKKINLGKESKQPLLKQLVQVEKLALKGDKTNLANHLVDPNEVIRNYASVRYKELPK